MVAEVSLDDIRIFAEVVRRGSFVKASQALDLPTSTVSRRVAELERGLGAALLLRSTRRLRLTEQGRHYYEACAGALEQLEQARLQLGQLQSEPQGQLRISASVPIGITLVQPWLEAFQLRYPKIRVELHLDNRYVDLLAEGFDLAFRGGPLDDSALRARRLRLLDYALVASPDYLQRMGRPTLPEDLTRHLCIVVATHGGRVSWDLQNAQGEKRSVPVNGSFRSNNVEAAIRAGMAGKGLLYLPTVFVAGALEQQRLVQLMPAWSHYRRELYAVYAPHPQLSLPLRTLLEELSSL